MSNQIIDDLDAVRQIHTALSQFQSHERERILRWVDEKLNSSSATTLKKSSSAPSTVVKRAYKKSVVKTAPASKISPLVSTPGSSDLKTFLGQVQPKTINQLAVATAHYHRNIAPASERKKTIGTADLTSAASFTKHKVAKYEAMIFAKAKKVGLLKNVSRGQYSLSPSGDSLVASLLSGEGVKRAGRKAGSKNKVKVKKGTQVKSTVPMAKTPGIKKTAKAATVKK